ncbi:MAG: hypothetical protein OXN17_09930 [Candidatus Poribacteria bacterium]|nr:hypothetical protein [Candidatus Poribacteria bacterium]
MSVNELLERLEDYTGWAVCFFAALPIIALIVSFVYKRVARRKLIESVFSAIIYVSAVPGVFACILIFYLLFFTGTNLLNINIVSSFLPIVSMGLVFGIIGKNSNFDDLPGFGRLTGLMLLIAIVSCVTLAIYKLRIFVGFFASIEALVGIAIAVFVLFKVGLARLGGKSKKGAY